MVASPRSRAGWSTSLSSTGKPALAKTMAMPPPIVPAPTMATLFTGMSGVSLGTRSEEHTSELQSLRHLVCRLLLEKKDNLLRTYREPSPPGGDDRRRHGGGVAARRV